MRRFISPGHVGYWQVAGAAVLWASAAVAARAAPDGVPGAMLAFVRMAIGGTALLLALGPRRVWRSMIAMSRPARRDLLAAALWLALFQWSFFAAVARAGAATAAIVSTAAAPLAASLLTGIGARAAPDVRWWAALALAAGGATLLSTGSQAGAGIALAGFAGVLYAAFTMAAARLEVNARAGLGGMTLALFSAALVLAPAALGGVGALLSPVGIALSLYLGVATAALPYALYTRGLREVAPTPALALQLLQPAATTALAYLLLGERFDAAGLAAYALLALAALLPLFTPPRTRPGSLLSRRSS